MKKCLHFLQFSYGAMKFCVVTSAKNFKVFNAVVAAVVVNMMNKFGAKQSPSEVVSHHNPMFKESLVIYSNDNIAVLTQKAALIPRVSFVLLKIKMTFFRTVSLGSYCGYFFKECLFAVKAFYKSSIGWMRHSFSPEQKIAPAVVQESRSLHSRGEIEKDFGRFLNGYSIA